MRTTWLPTTALLLLAPILLVGQQQQQPPKRSLLVQSIVGGDGQAVTLVQSYVNRELRALGDVVVTDNADESQYLLNIIVLPISTGYTISVLTAEHFASDLAKILLEHGETKPDTIDLLARSMKPMYQIAGYWLQTCPSSGLDKTIREAVAKFDVDTLQMHRDIRQIMNDTLHPKKD